MSQSSEISDVDNSNATANCVSASILIAVNSDKSAEVGARVLVGGGGRSVEGRRSEGEDVTVEMAASDGALPGVKTHACASKNVSKAEASNFLDLSNE